MEEEQEQVPGAAGDNVIPAATNGVGDWGNSDGYSLWESAGQKPENGLDGWEGRQETHDMFHDSYD
ncbi:hypothetical protein [Paenibacillus piscarius]|uniref:hypothetical protein n=1 Tax=Paenibacillus piscarius TaxID=1089681 RepID=UPI001EE8D379|nr:hypothetical protein [Paenibacillus piscarius]